MEVIMACCGKARQKFQNEVAKAKTQVVSPPAPPLQVSDPPTRQDRINMRLERIRRRSERIAARQARIALRNAAKNP